MGSQLFGSECRMNHSAKMHLMMDANVACRFVIYPKRIEGQQTSVWTKILVGKAL